MAYENTIITSDTLTGLEEKTNIFLSEMEVGNNIFSITLTVFNNIIFGNLNLINTPIYIFIPFFGKQEINKGI